MVDPIASLRTLPVTLHESELPLAALICTLVLGELAWENVSEDTSTVKYAVKLPVDLEVVDISFVLGGADNAEDG